MLPAQTRMSYLVLLSVKRQCKYIDLLLLVICVRVCLWGKLCITIAAFLIKANKDGCYSFITSQCGKMEPNMNAVLFYTRDCNLSVRLSLSCSHSGSSQEPPVWRFKYQNHSNRGCSQPKMNLAFTAFSQKWASTCAAPPLLGTIMAV